MKKIKILLKNPKCIKHALPFIPIFIILKLIYKKVYLKKNLIKKKKISILVVKEINPYTLGVKSLVA